MSRRFRHQVAHLAHRRVGTSPDRKLVSNPDFVLHFVLPDSLKAWLQNSPNELTPYAEAVEYISKRNPINLISSSVDTWKDCTNIDRTLCQSAATYNLFSVFKIMLI